MNRQDKQRQVIEAITNSVSGLAIKWDVDPTYLHRFVNGMKVGKATEEKIQKGIDNLMKSVCNEDINKCSHQWHTSKFHLNGNPKEYTCNNCFTTKSAEELFRRL